MEYSIVCHNKSNIYLFSFENEKSPFASQPASDFKTEPPRSSASVVIATLLFLYAI
uniref:Uncharacterized protein n=1 Tax=Rhizophagus irregularis (strain DAOM 181602 / DAOM 197198 / MUCL 43194) TaxID=747089 RepID=U9U1T7_RHIID